MATPLQALIVEDSEDDAKLIVREIRRGDYDVEWERVQSRTAMQDALARRSWDVIICDHSLPQFNSLNALEVLHESGLDLPFIIASGSIGEEAAVEALRAGAHDFVSKDKLARLVPAIRRELKDAEARRERRRAVEALSESERRYRGLFEHSPISIWEEDLSLVKKRLEALRREGIKNFGEYFASHPEVVAECASEIKVIDVNRFTLKLYQAESKEEILTNLDKVLHDESDIGFQQELVAIAENKMEFEWEIANQTLTGKLIYIHLFWSVLPGYEDTLSRVIVSIVDITERKQAEEALRKSLQVLREAESLGHTGSWEQDLITGKIFNSAENLRLFFGDDPGNKGEPFEDYSQAVHPDDREYVLQRHTELLEGGPGDIEYRVVWPDGSVHVIFGLATVVRDETGKAIRVYGTNVDITERKRAEAEVKQRLTELEAINRVSTALRSATTLEEMFPRLLDETIAAIHGVAGAIWLYDPGTDDVRMVHERGWEHQPAPVKRGQGIPGYVVASGEAYVSREIRTDTRLHDADYEIEPPGRGGACVPIRTANEVIGALYLNVDLPRELAEADVHLLTTLAEIAGNAIQRVRLYEQTVKQLERLSALRKIDIIITNSLDLTMTLGLVLDQVIKQLDIDAADVLLLKPGLQNLEFAAGKGFWTHQIESSSQHLGEGLAGQAVLERKTIYVGNLPADNRFKRSQLLAKEKFVSYYALPLIAKGKAKGLLEIFQRSKLAPGQEWVDFLEALGSQVAIAIDNLALFQDLQRSNMGLALAYDATIEGWSRAMDLRDKETEGHTQRVTELALKLARAMGLSDEEIMHMRRGALLHDIGKMGVPDNILLKPGPLTDDEWQIMRKHPVYAFDMLSTIDYLRPALDIPYCHHEKWDGTGYPRGLKGEQIPLSARIFAIVDVWDALRSDRPYRPAWKEEDALKYIRELSGKHFEPEIAEVFLQQMSHP